jgi:hypothetical protein
MERTYLPRVFDGGCHPLGSYSKEKSMIRSIILFSLLFLISCSQKKPAQQVWAKIETGSKGLITYDTSFVQQINKSLPEYRIRLIEGEDSTADLDKCFYEIHIQHDVDDSIGQIIKAKASIDYDLVDSKHLSDIEFVDMNFDGYLDIKMLNAMSMNGVNVGFAIYLFNPRNSQFIYNDRFSEILGGYSYSLNSSDSTITSEGELGCMGHCFSRDTYKITGDSLLLIRSILQDQDASGNPDKYLLTKKELVNGVLTVVKQDTVDY